MYSTVIILSLMFLSAFVTKSIKDTIKNNELYLNKKIIERVSDYFNNQYDTSKNLINQLYSDPRELSDTINFLSEDYETYIKMKLDKYTNTKESKYTGIDSFVKSCFSYNKNIKKVMFYSYKDDSLRIYEASGSLKYIYKIKNKLNLDYKNEEFNVALESMINFIDGNKDRDYYTFYNIKNPYKLDDIGIFIVQYGINEVDNIVKKYEESKGTIIVINKEGNVIYDSSNKYLNKKYPYLDKLKSSDTYVNLDEYSYLNRNISNSDIIVLGILPQKVIDESSRYIVVTIRLLTLLLIVLAIISTSSRMDKLSKRIQNILLAMKKVQKGELDTRVELGKEDDELSLISNNFNQMCEKLNKYIEEAYLLELNQKNAEMAALQSQINPHFLYNTLESIRMKAISNGDRETGKMLYNLATLFRSMVKGKTFITINEELEHCKLYLELFKFRYKDKFDYCIDVEPKLLNKEIIKFSIQPIIENFVVHGVRLDNKENFILITLEEEANDIKICIEDNGIGIPQDKIDQINESLKNMSNKTRSIGIINVHERIILTYGKEYGVTVENRKPTGTLVTIKIPCKEVDKNV